MRRRLHTLHTLFPFLQLLAVIVAGSGVEAGGLRQEYNFNPGWLLAVGDHPGAERPDFDDSGWEPVTLPRAWNEDDAFRLSIHEHPTGIAWYRKHFTLPENSEGRRIYIEFEGARQLAEVWVNGNRVGSHENGVMAFGFELTRYLRPWPESNRIAVRTDNSWDYREQVSGQTFQWADQNFNANYGGLVKNVRLHLTGELHQTLPLYSSLGTTGVYVYATDIDVARQRATVHVEAEVLWAPREDKEFEFLVEVRDREGELVKAFTGGTFTVPGRGRVVATASADLEDLHFWSWGYGYLYEVKSMLKVDGEVVDSVVTQTGFRKTEFGHGVVKLNERTLHIKGYAQRTSNEWPAVGLSVAPWLSDFSNGLMVESGANMVRWMHVTPWRQDVESCDRVGLMQMLPAGDSEHDATGRKWVQRLELMRDAIIYFRNNPSVIVYEAGNKGVSEEHMAEMKALRDRFDPHGGRAMGSREMLGSREAEYGGEMLYINKSAGIPYWQNEYSRDEGLRKYWDEYSPPYHEDGEGPLYRGRPARSYNRNQDSHAIENVERWYDYWRERPGTGERVNAGGLNIIFSDTNTHYRGAENYRRSGEVDPMRIPKDGYYAHQVMWNGWVDPATPAAHIIGHWNYAEGVVKDVYVVANTESVELLLNGRSLGQGTRSHHFLHTFSDVPWEPGRIEAVGRDAAGNEVCRAFHETAGAPASLRLTRIGPQNDLRADGAHLLLAQVEVVDEEGRRCPTALDMVRFELEGPAEWRGGIAQGPDNYILATSLPVEGGVNRVLVRSTTEAGTIRLRASADGLEGDSLAVESEPFQVQDGLSDTFPGAGLAGSLAKGPTPEGDSVTRVRTAVSVREAKAESGDPDLAFDDNEATAWTGPGPIVFHLERPARLHEITMKVGGFRARSYPLRIRVGERVVFTGVTPRSLGYITLPLVPTTGDRVEIELLAGSEAREAFGEITELVDQGNATTGEENVGERELSLIEIEFYEPVPGD